MEMDYLGASGSFMKIIHVLGDDGDIPVSLKLCNGSMCGIRLDFGQLGSALIIEIKYQRRIAIPSFDRGDVLHLEVVP